jgi:hypothetical protein
MATQEPQIYAYPCPNTLQHDPLLNQFFEKILLNRKSSVPSCLKPVKIFLDFYFPFGCFEKKIHTPGTVLERTLLSMLL